MRKILLLSLLLIFISLFDLSAQFSGTWTPIESLKKNDRPNKLLISSEADYVNLQKKTAFLFEAYSVKIDNIQSPKNIFALLNQWTDITELYLKNSGIQLTDNDFEQLKYIEHIIVECEPGDSNLLENIYKIPNLEKITLIFKEEPKDWDFLYFYRNIKTLHIYGTFLSETFYDIVDKLMLYPHLTELGLSIDYATDLPSNMNLLGELQILKLYDNLTRLNYDHQAQVQPERFNINGVLGNDKPITFSVLFYSEDYGLTARENRWIESIWSGKRDIFDPPAGALASNKGTKNLYILTPKPIFPADINIPTLLEDLYPSAETFSINTRENTIIHTESGCNLFIPAGSLLKKDGSVFEGNAFVSIRFMQDLISAAFRGLDMRVTKYRGSPLYRSDVMIEIEVSDGVFPLQFNNSMNIRLDVPVTDTSTTFYFYDNESKGFMDYEMFKTVFYSSETAQTPIRYDEWIRNNLSKNKYILDLRSFNERFRNPETYFLFDQGDKVERYLKEGKFYTAKEYQWEKNKNTDKTNIKIQEGRNLLKITKINPKNKAKGDVFIQIEDKAGLFNELQVFRRALFKYSDSLSNKEFNAAYTRNKRYSDFRIEKDRERNKWQIILKSDEGYKVIDIAHLLYKKSGKPYSEKKSLALLEKFYKIQGQRSASFETFLKQRLEDYTTFYQARQTSWERKNSFRTVFIKSTGIYGFMSIDNEQPERIGCFINYLDNNGIPIDVKTLFLLDKTNRNVYQFYKGNTSINLNNTSLILCADFKGQLHYIDGDALRSYGLSDGSIYFLRLNSLTHPPRSIEDFKKYIKYDKVK
ncbi:MAG: hypothetical protein M9892_03675 [Bacteroidetes bacterium]|nr:hypothetical protein [Bacteroidota bacterium]